MRLVGAGVAGGLVSFFSSIVLPRLFPHLLLDHPQERKSHDKPTHLWGGMAMVLGFFTFITISDTSLPMSLWGVLLGAALLGVIDDLRGVSALPKLFFQGVLGVGFVATHGHLPFFGPNWVEVCGTILFFVLVLNGYNFLDGLNGLLGGHIFLSALALLIMGITMESPLVAVLGAGMVATTSGFLIPNSKGDLFMGDGGSLFLGVAMISGLLALSSIETLGRGVWWVALPLLLPLGDLGWVTIRRMSKGRSPFVADKKHLHHILAKRLGAKRSVAILLVITAGLSTLGVLGALGRISP